MKYKVVLAHDYFLNRNRYMEDIIYLYLNDDNKMVDLVSILNHLDFIFAIPNSMLILVYNNGKLVSMVNAYECHSINHDWCICSLFVKKNYRGKSLGFKTLKRIVEEIKKHNPNRIISGIEKDNISSIKVHEKVGFVNSCMMWNELQEGFPEDHMGFIYKV